ncbi:DUF4625 domain-containing protein [Flavobacterium sp. NST-5]|uniref:DUF4625 domain-containing protein n=1 Tax=Flavobacterium ichthyis TaxID=2698827 RepID=A0ABW9ZDU5_9FLAO|nr:DUF4625 domain-containing protein [Flavobacterium ichthyis]NBL65914.1 DUF4625 domain-containing protein [Flavobacterium ichthyis]
MKNTTKFLGIFAVVLSTFFVSCSSDDNNDMIANNIEIDLTEVGSANSGQATAGQDLHLEGEILASQKIATVVVELHHETDTNAPEITQTFTNYNGQLNATFHEHILIPANQPAGHYHLHFTVVDQNGNSESVDRDVEIISASALFSVNLTEFGHGTPGNYHGHPGQDLHIEGVITSVNPISTISIEMHHETNASAPHIEAVYTDYAGQTNVNFHKHLLIPANQPTGDYHVHFTVSDNQGNSQEFDYEFTIE